MLRISGVSAGYDEREVLHAIDLDVPDGQLVCVLGPSGSGKSTLLRVLAGLEPVWTGSVELAGRDLGRLAPHERDVGMMFQDYALFPHRDVGQNVAFGLRMRGEAAATIRARVAELLALVGLPGAERRAVGQLSGGEQQRVALARALAPRPRLLMLDEPMGSLDRSLRERLPEELRDIFAELGLTVIYVTHDQDEALTVADRVVLLDDGRVEADGSPESLWTRPPTAWAARFLGYRNVAPADLVGDVLVTPWGHLPVAVAVTGTSAGASLPAVPDSAGRPESAADGLTVVLRPSGLTLAEHGPIRGRVTARRFRGDHVLVVVAVDGAPPLHVEARHEALPEVGMEVAVAVASGGVLVIEGS